MAQDETLDQKQQEAILFLVDLGNISQAAKRVGISRSQLRRWIAQPLFKAALRAAEAEALADLRRELLANRQLAIDTIIKVMTGRKVPAGARLRAADVILRRLIQVSQILDFEERLKALEEAVQNGKS